MKKIAVVYQSKAGHTKKYADWLKEDLQDVDVISVDRFNPTQMMAYKLVIFACGVYGDKLSIMDFVKKNITAVSPQKTMVLAVSWYTNDSNEAKQKLIEENFPEQFKSSIRIFVVNSGIDKAGLSFMDKASLKTAEAAIKRKDGRSTDDLNTLGIINGYSDYTEKENLASIEKAVDEFFNPPAKAAGRPAAPRAEQPKPAAPAPQPKPAAPVPTPAPQPKPVSEMKTGADALSSMEDAFKALKAPKPAPAPKPEPAPAPKPEPAPAPEPKPVRKDAPDPMKAAVASSVKDAIAALSSGSAATNYAPAPAFGTAEDDGTYSEAVADSIMLAQAAAEAATSAPKVEDIAPVPKPAPRPAEEPVAAPAVEDIAPAPKPAPAPSPKPEQSAASKLEQLINSAVPAPKPEPVQAAPEPEPVPEPAPEPVKEAPRKNSYMELFAQRRRRTATEETVAALAPAPAPTPAPTPTPAPAPAPEKTTAAYEPADTSIDLDFSMDETPFEPIQSATKADTSYAGSAEIADDFDFLTGTDETKGASSRALNAVQDLAKAREKAEAEAAAAKAVKENRLQPEGTDDILEKMRQDMKTLAEEAESADESPAEEEDLELDGLLFTNDVDYDIDAEFAEPVTEAAGERTAESHTNLDIRKLQEEINASIEQNKAAKERLDARFKKEKAEVVNPFLVQFDEEDEGKGKKKKKAEEQPPKFLEEPLDPDIFFKKPGKDYSVDTESMPEIKFRNQ